MKILSVSNTKTRKGEAQGYLTGILHLAPANLSGYNVCPKASKGCIASCLNTAGRGRFTMVQEARIKKTKWYFEARESFMLQLVKDIMALERKAKRMGLTPVVRLNGTSDIPWENVSVYTQVRSSGVTTVIHANSIMDAFPHLTFYDYTKRSNRKNIPSNYHLTFSQSESNSDEALGVLVAGGSVAVVFDELPKTYKGFEVISGDESDARFADPKNVVVGLKAKGKAKKDSSGFVVITRG